MPAGAPTKYKAAFVEQGEKLCRLGATDEQIGDFFGVTAKCIWEWKTRHPKFGNALKEGKGVSDQQVVRSLDERACGYSTPETKVFCQQGEVTQVEVQKHYPPETVACIFWLKNRMPDEWRDMKNVDIHVMTDEERVNRIDALLQSVLDREVAELTKH